MKENIVFHRSFYEGIKDLPPDIYKDTCNAILGFALDEIEPEIEGVAKAVFTIMRPMLGEKKASKPKNDKPRKKNGQFGHVLLTEEERERLIADYPNTAELAIRLVDEYCERTGKRYKNYNLVIRNWGIDAAVKTMAKNAQVMPTRNRNYAEMERELKRL